MNRVPFYARLVPRAAGLERSTTRCTRRCRSTRTGSTRSARSTPSTTATAACFTRYLESELDGRPDLIAKSLPDYPPFGKRMLLDNGWFAALRRDDVELVTEAVAEITPTGLRGAGGTEVAADVIVLATGFHAHRVPAADRRPRPRRARRCPRSGAPRTPTPTSASPSPASRTCSCSAGPAPRSATAAASSRSSSARSATSSTCSRRWRDAGSARGRGPPGGRARPTRRSHDEAHARMLWTHPGMTNWYRNAAGRVVTRCPGASSTTARGSRPPGSTTTGSTDPSRRWQPIVRGSSPFGVLQETEGAKPDTSGNQGRVPPGRIVRSRQPGRRVERATTTSSPGSTGCAVPACCSWASP